MASSERGTSLICTHAHMRRIASGKENVLSSNKLELNTYTGMYIHACMYARTHKSARACMNFSYQPWRNVRSWCSRCGTWWSKYRRAWPVKNYDLRYDTTLGTIRPAALSTTRRKDVLLTMQLKRSIAQESTESHRIHTTPTLVRWKHESMRF